MGKVRTDFLYGMNGINEKCTELALFRCVVAHHDPGAKTSYHATRDTLKPRVLNRLVFSSISPPTSFPASISQLVAHHCLICPMARTTATARKTTGGRAPRKEPKRSGPPPATNARSDELMAVDCVPKVHKPIQQVSQVILQLFNGIHLLLNQPYRSIVTSASMAGISCRAIGVPA